jgi:plastocyanin
MLAVPLLFGGCGDDDDGGTDAASVSAPLLDDGTVNVLAEDIAFPEDTYSAEAGTVSFRYENVGNIRHTLVIEDPSGDGDLEGLDLAVDAFGDVDEGSIDLEAGTYTMYCDVAGHRAAGLVADLVVE